MKLAEALNEMTNNYKLIKKTKWDNSYLKYEGGKIVGYHNNGIMAIGWIDWDDNEEWEAYEEEEPKSLRELDTIIAKLENLIKKAKEE